MREHQYHKDAFNLYFTLKQDGKSTKEAMITVYKHFNVTRRSAYRWKDTFNWDNREAVRAKNVNRIVEGRLDSTIADNKAKYLSFYHKMLEDLKQDGFNVKIKSAGDLEKVIRGAMLLQGESTDIVESKMDVSVHDKIEERLKYYMKLKEQSKNNKDESE